MGSSTVHLKTSSSVSYLRQALVTVGSKRDAFPPVCCVNTQSTNDNKSSASTKSLRSGTPLCTSIGKCSEYRCVKIAALIYSNNRFLWNFCFIKTLHTQITRKIYPLPEKSYVVTTLDGGLDSLWLLADCILASHLGIVASHEARCPRYCSEPRQEIVSKDC